MMEFVVIVLFGVLALVVWFLVWINSSPSTSTTGLIVDRSEALSDRDEAWLEHEPNVADDAEWGMIVTFVRGNQLVYADDFLSRIPSASYSAIEAFRGKGMRYYLGNWTAMYNKMRARHSRERLVPGILVPEPDNPYDPTAVAICVYGRMIGHVPAEESRSVFQFVIANGGLVKVPVTLWFDPGKTKNSIRVHLARPYKMSDGWKTDLKAVFWTSPKWSNKLIAFVEKTNHSLF